MRTRLIALGCVGLFAAASPARADTCETVFDRDRDGSVFDTTLGFCAKDDCNDNDASVHPGATEVCGDGKDQDCDGRDLPCPTSDGDADGHLPVSAGGDDCDDRNAAIHPGAREICGNGKDDDCAGGDASCGVDMDRDGYFSVESGGNDCNDASRVVHPHAPEACGNGVDEDCSDGDARCEDDADRDGHRSLAVGGDDCDDFDASTYPGAAELCGDFRDQDCDESDLPCPDPADQDGDGTKGPAGGGDDCNDHDPAIHPGATEVCGDELDEDCDGRDLPCGGSVRDLDGDGQESFVFGGPDCNDNDVAIHADAVEVCGDGVDQDCDGSDPVYDANGVCVHGRTSNPLFDTAREASPVLHTAPDADDGCATAGLAPGWALACALVLARRGRGRR